jgi:hypothetical protein
MSDVPCKGQDIFRVTVMLPLCAVCPEDSRRACAQSAADAPFIPEGVWAGLVLPRERALLPGPTMQVRYPDEPYHEKTKENPNGAGRPEGFVRSGRNYDPELVK